MGRNCELEERTRKFAVRVLNLFRALPKTTEAQVIGKQLLRAGPSVGANYRAVERARSDAEFISKLGIVIEEADEVGFWLRLLTDGKILPKQRLEPLMQEASELVAIFVASTHTARRRASR